VSGVTVAVVGFPSWGFCPCAPVYTALVLNRWHHLTGTGKTETTKDLARALALPCYVFNCSDQMNYQTMADIFKGCVGTGVDGGMHGY
jgi:hypothetical protein